MHNCVFCRNPADEIPDKPDMVVTKYYVNRVCVATIVQAFIDPNHKVPLTVCMKCIEELREGNNIDTNDSVCTDTPDSIRTYIQYGVGR